MKRELLYLGGWWDFFNFLKLNELEKSSKREGKKSKRKKVPPKKKKLKISLNKWINMQILNKLRLLVTIFN